MTRLQQIQPNATEAVIKDTEMAKFIREKDEPVFEIVNPRQEHHNPHPLLEVEIALRGCEISGVFTKQKGK